MDKRTGSQVIIDALQEAGVDLAFGYPGGAIMPLYDTLLDSSIRHILTRHEQAAVHAADGYSRASDKLGVCIATSGPGATNLVTGICTASMDSSRVLCITGQVNSKLIGTDGFQEADIIGITAVATKQSYLLRTTDELPRVLAEAIFIASSGRPGPVIVDVPKDVLLGTTDRRCSPLTELAGYEHAPKHHSGDLARAHGLLSQAQRPVCVVGGGCRLAGATDLFRRWVEKTNIPVTNTLMGMGACDTSYPHQLGMLGMHGMRRANRAVTECDVLVALGMRFDDRVTGMVSKFAPHAKVIHVDIDEAEIGKIVSVDVPIHGNLREVMQAWLALLDTDDTPCRQDWLDYLHGVGDGLRPDRDDASGIVPTMLIGEVLKLAEPGTIVVTDVGQQQMWTAQRVKPARPENFITSGGAGTMGFGLPSAIGAQCARPDERVLVIAGDGGFQMTMAELATVRRENLPLKILIVDNKYLGMVRQWQELFCDRRYSAVDLSDNPDFAALARVYKIDAFTLENVDAMADTLQAWWQCDGPALLHCISEPEDNVYPMVPAGAGLSDMLE